MNHHQRTQQLCREIEKNPLNNSKTKMQYSFSKSCRFRNRLTTSISKDSAAFYNLPSQISKRSTSFGYGERNSLIKSRENPGPNQYMILSDILAEAKGMNFRLGRQAVKFGASDVLTTNPGPSQYNPNPEFNKSSIAFSLRKKLHNNQFDMDTKALSPGPIYHIDSTMLDRNKVLSIYIRRTSTRIVPDRNESRLRIKTQAGRAPGPQTYSFNVMTRKGDTQFGKRARRTFMTSQKRFKGVQKEENIPGPGNYNTFSEFVSCPEDAIKK